MFDSIVELFFGTATDPVELAVRFLLCVMIFDCVFGLINNLINSARK